MANPKNAPTTNWTERQRFWGGPKGPGEQRGLSRDGLQLLHASKWFGVMDKHRWDLNGQGDVIPLVLLPTPTGSVVMFSLRRTTESKKMVKKTSDLRLG